MRLVTAGVLAVVAAFASGASALAGPGSPDMDYSSDDLVCRFGYWDGCDGWVATNRLALLGVSRRATPVAAGAARVEDAAARGKARDALLLLVKSRDDHVAAEAVLALGRAGDARDIATLAKIAADAQSTRKTRRMAALGLGHLPIGSPAQADEARKVLVSALAGGIRGTDEFACFWANCAYALAMRGDAAAVPLLFDMRRTIVEEGDPRAYPEVVGAICYALGALGHEDVLAELGSQLRLRREVVLRKVYAGDARWSVLHALAQMGGAKPVGLLREAAIDKRDFVRCVALQALGGTGGAADDASVKILRDALANDNVPLCRQMAAIGLGRTGHASAGAALAAAMDKASSVDRRFIAVGLALWLRRTPDPKLSAQLAALLADSGSADERVPLMVACGLAGVQAARPSIVGAMPKSRAGQAAASASFALGLLGAGPSELKLLHEVVAQSTDPTARREAALALGLLRDHSVVDQLADIIRSKAPDMDRGAAAVCLGRVGDDADIEFVLGRIADRGTSDPLRACLVHGLGRLLDRDEGARLGRLVANGRWYWETDIVDPFSDLRALME
ncbi:MAG: HEAT repeat domain-containing protein [Planctomycetes bacterium]|nr:HEAT repeat domain-containing protein [Planctomycetota bacterium]